MVLHFRNLNRRRDFMFRIVNYEDIDENKIDESHILIDLRSPSEYLSETIPGAINIPLFNDEERKLIGTIYMQESIEKAKRIGVEIASKRLPSIYEEVHTLDEKYQNLVFFCARGGFRSRSLVSLFKSIGINAIKLDNGYKSYRRYVIDQLPNITSQIQFVVLYGNTGTGKTDILKHLEKEGMNVLDLEACANHRGSLLGSVGLGEQSSQKMFESLIFKSLRNRNSNLVFVEGESKRIGKDIIPDYIFEAMKNGINIRIEANMETRIANLLRDYVHDTDSELVPPLNLLRKYLGDKNIDKYIDLINKHEYEPVIEELLIKYYDPLYEHKNRDYNSTFHNDNSMEAAKAIIEWVKTIKDQTNQ